jgi:transposase
MENAIISQLDPNLECDDYIIRDKQIIFKISSIRYSVRCPYCRQQSNKVHSVYQREIQDIPIQDKQTILLLNTRKMFCTNPNCEHKTFSEDICCKGWMSNPLRKQRRPVHSQRYETALQKERDRKTAWGNASFTHRFSQLIEPAAA